MDNKQIIEERDEIEIDLLELFQVVWSHIITILVCGIVVAGLTGLISRYMIQPTYASTSKLFILTQSTSITSLADIQVGTSLTQDYMELIKSRPVVEGVIENLGLEMTYEEMLGKLSVDNPTSTRILKITITDSDPHVAKEVADEFADVAKKQISAIMATDEPNIVEQGHVNEYPISPNVKRNAVLGGAIGVFISAAVFIILYLLDDTIKSSDDIEKYLNLNTLASIPIGTDEKNEAKKRKKRIRKAVKGGR
ncbi:MAG: hypothetical protein K6G65_04275 [Lachnospiraceae bacterium]|nr:hypothetical protein [Lachnospiraceae bacterium]